MDIYLILLIVAAFLCSLVAGFLFAFAVVAMPGIKNLRDGEFIRGFQVMDKIIQDNQILFMIVWAGSVVLLVISAVLSIWRLEGTNAIIMIVAVLTYLLGVQLPTAIINVPLNNQIQTVDVDAVDEAAHKEARVNFEDRWNRFNVIRTGFACLTSLLLIVLISSL